MMYVAHWIRRRVATRSMVAPFLAALVAVTAACATDPVAVDLVVCEAGTGPDCVNGSLDLTVSGLPEGLSAAVTVQGADGFSMEVTSSTTLSLLSGDYTVEARTVQGVEGSYDPEAASQVVSVSGEAAVTVKYVQTGTGT